MKLHAPTMLVFLTGLALVVLALIGHFVPSVPFLTQYQFWVMLAGYVVVALGCIV